MFKGASLASRSLMHRLSMAGGRGSTKGDLLSKMLNRGFYKKEKDLLAEMAGASHLDDDLIEKILVNTGRRPEVVGNKARQLTNLALESLPGYPLSGIIGKAIEGTGSLKGVGPTIGKLINDANIPTASVGKFIGPIAHQSLGTFGAGFIGGNALRVLITDAIRLNGASRLAKRLATNKGLTADDLILRSALKKEFSNIDPSMLGIAKRNKGKIAVSGLVGAGLTDRLIRGSNDENNKERR